MRLVRAPDGRERIESADRKKLSHDEFSTLILSAAEGKWAIGKHLCDLRDLLELEGHWRFWAEANLPFGEAWERRGRAFYRYYRTGLPTDSKQLTLETARDDSRIEGNVTLSPSPTLNVVFGDGSQGQPGIVCINRCEQIGVDAEVNPPWKAVDPVNTLPTPSKTN